MYHFTIFNDPTKRGENENALMLRCWVIARFARNGFEKRDFLSGFQPLCYCYFASYELEEVLKRQMSPADTLFENRAVVLLERSAKWLRTKKELMEAFLRAEKKKEKDSQPHQPRKLQYTYHLAMLSSSSTLTTLLV